MQYTLSLKLKTEKTVFFGPGPARLLLLIDQGDSLNQAAAKMGMAYSKAWRIIREAESSIGFPLLERQRGGNGGGGSELTGNARKLLAGYSRFQKEMYKLGNQLFEEAFGDFL